MKMKFESGKIKWLIPALALLVILESVLIVDNLSSSKLQENFKSVTEIAKGKQPAIINFEGEQKVKKDQVGQLRVILTVSKEMDLDGIDLYIKYDPQAIEIQGIDPTEKFSYVGRNWIEPDKERMLISLMEPEIPTGVKFFSGSKTELALIKYRALTSGRTKLNLYDPNKKQGTILAGNGEEYEFAKEDIVLEIN